MPNEFERYLRQIIIPGFGEAGQHKLASAHVLLVGLGGLGSAIAPYLVAAGVGRLTIIDNQKVELSNLNRQLLHWEKDIGRFKAESAWEKLQALNPSVEIQAIAMTITGQNARRLIRDADVVVDGMDNFPTRFVLNTACVRLGKPFVHGAVQGLAGQITTIIPGKGPCLKCVIPQLRKKKAIFPVLGAVPGVIGCLEAMETIKLITGLGEPMVGRMLFFDGLCMRFCEIEVSRNPACPICGKL
jgi:adenylyltransferase/sulfurtransferase